MSDENKDNPDIYALRDPSTLTEKFIAPPEHSEIFAVQESVIGVTLGAGISLCNAYRLDKRLSQNGAGETWKASDLAASRNVIVYLPPLFLRTDAAAMKSVSQTARHIEALEHPRIVPLMASMTDPEHGFFAVRKYVNGKSLDLYQKDFIKRYKKFPSAKVLKLLNDVAHALDYAHSVNIPHGDLCSQNIIIGLDDEVYIDNFALLPIHAFSLSDKKPYQAPELTPSSEVIEEQVTEEQSSTEKFEEQRITEEQNAAKQQNATVASDIFALAVIAYELLAGRVPISSESMEETPLPVPNAPSAVDTVIRKAMARAPDDRYDSCGEFVKAIEKGFQESMRIKPVHVTPTSVSPGNRKKILSRILFATAFVLVLGVAGFAIWQTQLPKQPQQVAVQSKQENEGIEPPTLPSPTSPNQPKVEPTQFQPLSQEPKIINDEKPAVPIEPEPPLPEPAPEIPPEPTPPLEPQPTKLPDDNGVEEMPPKTDELTSDSTEDNPLEGNTEDQPSDWVPLTVENFTQETKSPPLPEPTEGDRKEISLGGVSAVFHCYKEDIGYFWIQEKPVTQEMWLAVMKEHKGHQPDDVNVRLPEVSVAWRDIEQFLEKINPLDVLVYEGFNGYRFAVPTKKQWEKAVPHDKVLEWCSDLSDKVANDRMVCGKDIETSRDPLKGYEIIGFRLVIVSKEPRP